MEDSSKLNLLKRFKPKGCIFIFNFLVFSYEYLASACFGSVGKFSIEFAQIGLMLGTCIAFYIVISSLLVEVFADIIQSEPTLDSREELRRQFCLFLGFFIVLPLGLLRNMSSIGKLGKHLWYLIKYFQLFSHISLLDSTSFLLPSSYIDQLWTDCSILNGSKKSIFSFQGIDLISVISGIMPTEFLVPKLREEA